MKTHASALTRSLLSWLVGLCIISLSLSTLAVPTDLTVQGRLTNAAGQPAQGDYTLQATIYDAPDGNVVWTDSYDVTVSKGVFDITLGSDLANPLVSSMFIDNPQLWLGIKVQAGPGVALNGDNELPKRPITTVGYAFAAQYALMAKALDCKGCVSADILDFDPVTQAELTNALGDVVVPTGACPDGEAVTSLGADGTITCAPSGGKLPADGLNEISNDLLTNQFIDLYSSAGEVDIPDFHPPGVLDTITIPNAGLAQALSVSLNISNSDLSSVTVKLFAPDGTEYLLFDKDNPGTQLGATYPSPNPTLDGDLSLWVGKNPQGNWILNVIDLGFNVDLETDGKINGWSITVHTLSGKKIASSGDIYMEGNQVKKLGVPTDDNDATTKKYVDEKVTNATKPEAFLKSGAVLTQWGTPKCPNGFEKLYDGVLFATHYSHSGSEGALCMMSNEAGGVPGPSESSSSYDLLYSVRIDHKSNTGVPNSNNVRCSKCYTPTKGPCFRVENSNQCPGDWDTVYSGFLFGSHHGHSGPMGRICIDVDNWENSGQGDGGNYHYATTIHSTGGTGGGASYSNNTLVRCAWCCRP
jgi:subtilisin-like proprotein convertase family protein